MGSPQARRLFNMSRLLASLVSKHALSLAILKVGPWSLVLCV
jgi:hypothetical protein